MNQFRKTLAKNQIIRNLSSVKITTVCLIILFILTFWGTLYQVDHGLYESQEKFFNSFVFIMFGFLPVPGARLVLWVLFVNLICTCLIRLKYSWEKAGIIVIHVGLLTFLISSFVIFHASVESNLTLLEGRGSNVSSSYYDWEISVWKEEGNERAVEAVNIDSSQSGKTFALDGQALSITVKNYYKNCDAYTSGEPGQEKALNASGIASLEPRAAELEPEKNNPGGRFLVKLNGKEYPVLLYGGEPKPLAISTDQETYFIQLRRRRYQLPFTVILKDFKKEVHPNTEIARSFESLVDVVTPGSNREILISMNEPLRYKNFTLFQASYQIDELGREYSTFAVVDNAGRWLPYISSSLVFAGLLLHLVLMGVNGNRKRKKK